MIAGVYYPTWKDEEELTTIDPKFNTVYLAFADPRAKFNGVSWAGTGLNFSKGFQETKADIAVLKSRGVKVMLSVGGATYPFPIGYPFPTIGFNAKEMVKLAVAMGVDGIDIDWEPFHGATDEWPLIIQSFHNEIVPGNTPLWLSAAVWSTGCMQPREGDRFRGINIPGLVQKGDYLDWLNIMAYDSGPPENVDPLGCFYTYRVYYKKPLVLGFQPGKMGWGDYKTTQDDVVKGCEYAANDGDGANEGGGYPNGIFIWHYFKDDFANGVTRDFIIDTALKAFGNDDDDNDNVTQCPWCNNAVSLNKLTKK